MGSRNERRFTHRARRHFHQDMGAASLAWSIRPRGRRRRFTIDVDDDDAILGRGDAFELDNSVPPAARGHASPSMLASDTGAGEARGSLLHYIRRLLFHYTRRRAIMDAAAVSIAGLDVTMPMMSLPGTHDLPFDCSSREPRRVPHSPRASSRPMRGTMRARFSLSSAR